MNEMLSTGSYIAMLVAVVTFPFNIFVKELEWPESSLVNDGTAYDFIIVGGGTAGSVLASRLSDIGNWSILLIEAGDNPPVQSIVPGLAFTLINTKWDWAYDAIDDHYSSQAVKGHAIQWNGGKMLGGSSAINFMFYNQGCKTDYDKWEKLGNKGWSWKDVKKYYNSFEKLDGKLLHQKPYLKTEYGMKGPLTLKKFDNPFSEIKMKIKTALKEIGFLDNKKFFPASEPFGVGELLSFTENGMRSSAATAFLLPIKNRLNLNILKNSLVTKIIIDNGTALGVQLKNGDKTLFAKKEVILTAGSFRTPQLLMLSGIGEKDELSKFNIETKVERQVGKHLKDHILVPVFFYRKPVEPLLKNYQILWRNFVSYIQKKSGLFATSLLSDLVAFFSLENQNQPEFELINIYSPVGAEFAALSCWIGYRFADDVCADIARLNIEHDILVIHFVLLQSASSGRVRLKSYDVNDNPLIESGYFSNFTDLDHVAKGMNVINSLAKTRTFKAMGMKLLPLRLAECNDLELGSEEYWRCYALNTAGTLYHPVGTAKMGLKSDLEAIVDNNLRVHGVQHLRIGDASVFPSQVSGHTTASVIMIAEKLADMIKKEYSLK